MAYGSTGGSGVDDDEHAASGSAKMNIRIIAMAMLENGTLVDPYGGRFDLENKILKHVSSAFIEDPLRVLRVARFAAKFPDFEIHRDTMALMSQIVSMHMLEHLPHSRQ